jgi:flagellar P-ring protein precursor FlgI
MKSHLHAKLILITILACLSFNTSADRIKDLVSIAGVRTNQLLGYGLVVGLDGTGGKTKFAQQSLKNMLNRFGITVPANVNVQSKNIAAVAVHASLPAFVKPGQTIDITVSSLGDAKSLKGGSLLMTPLKGADGKVYAVAQGNLVVGGFGVSGNDGSRISVNIPSAGRIPNGATVERIVPNAFSHGDSIVLNLNTADFTTANRISTSINKVIGPGIAKPLDATSIKVSSPKDTSQRVAFVSLLENIDVVPADAPARVIINSRTGTIVIGNHVKVMPAAVTHGSLTVTIAETTKVSQPEPFSKGQTVVVPSTDIQFKQDNNRMFLFNPGINLDEIVRAVNQVGAAPGDLVAILEALKQAGALRADLIII